MLRVAGGIVLFSVGWQVLNSPSQEEVDMPIKERSESKLKNMAFYPFTLPLTTGPGSISVAVALGATPARDVGDVLGCIIGMVLNCLVIWVCYRYSDRVTRSLGVAGADALTEYWWDADRGDLGPLPETCSGRLANRQVRFPQDDASNAVFCADACGARGVSGCRRPHKALACANRPGASAARLSESRRRWPHEGGDARERLDRQVPADRGAGAQAGLFGRMVVSPGRKAGRVAGCRRERRKGRADARSPRFAGRNDCVRVSQKRQRDLVVLIQRNRDILH